MKQSARKTLPLGIDFGSSRIRVALCEQDADAQARLVAVASRDRGEHAGRALAEAVNELGTRERRCVFGLCGHDAILRIASFPSMTRHERHRAANLEAARLLDYPVAEATVSLSPIHGDERWTLGIARRTALTRRISAAKYARLTPVAIDDVSLALRRIYPHDDAVIDIGEDRTQVTVFAEPLPIVITIQIGGAAFTEAIARSFGIDARAAEERKRQVGFAGAGERERDAWIAAVNDAFERTRSTGRSNPQHVVLSGNGSRIAGLREALESGTAVSTRVAEIASDASDALPPDVLRAAGADWAIAYGLSLWHAAS